MTDLLRCSDVADKLPLYVGGDLEPTGLEAVRGHLAECERCAEELQVVSRVRGALITALRDEGRAPAGSDGGLGLWPGIRAVLVREGRLGSDAQRPRPVTPLSTAAELTSPWGGRLPRIAAAAAAVLFLAWGAGRLRTSLSSVVPGADPVAPAAPVATSLVALDRQGGLRRVLPGEEALADSAEALGSTATFPPSAPYPFDPSSEVPLHPWLQATTVAGYR